MEVKEDVGEEVEGTDLCFTTPSAENHNSSMPLKNNKEGNPPGEKMKELARWHKVFLVVEVYLKMP